MKKATIITGFALVAMMAGAERAPVAEKTFPDFLPSGKFSIGVNYWASHAAVEMWRKWDAKEVEKDLAVLKEHGLTLLRVFPNWRDFQPIVEVHSNSQGYDKPRETHITTTEVPRPDTPEGYAGVDPVMMDRFGEFCDLADRYGLKFIVCIMTGQMTSRLFVPPALDRMNLYSDPYALKWEGRFYEYFVRRFRDRKCIVAWETGNETRILSTVQDESQAETWLRYTHSIIRLNDPTRPVIGPDGVHITDRHPWSIDAIASQSDVTTVHPYYFNVKYGAMGSFEFMSRVPADCRAVADISGRPAFVEEHNVRRSNMGRGQRLEDFCRAQLWNLWATDCRGLLWWGAFDQTGTYMSPYNNYYPCQELGAFTRDRRPVGNAVASRRFAQFLSSLDFDALPAAKPDAVFFVSETTLHPVYALARKAGIFPAFASPEHPVPDAKCYFFPNCFERGNLPHHRWDVLKEKVRNGATLYLSWNQTYITEIEEVFGVRVEEYRPKKGEESVDFGGFGVSVKLPDETVFSATTAEVLARDGKGVPVLFRNRYGKGKAYLLSFAPEAEAGHELYEGDFYRLYSRICPVKRIVSVPSPEVSVSEHFVSGRKAYVVAVNNSLRPFSGPVAVASGWRIAGFRTDRPDLVSFAVARLEMAPDTGVLLELVAEQP